MTDKLIGWLLVLIASLLNGGGSLLLKQSRLKATEDGIMGLLFNPWFIGGLACYGINVIFFAKALEKLPVSVAYPVLAGTSLALITMVAATVFQERMAPIHWGGAVFIFVGILLITRPASQPQPQNVPAPETPASASVD
ncbi:MAG: DMT family transporter [Verrucomicrobiia bacterium]|jgi:multidrug transporter EmrE-like cation transporter